MDSVDIASLKRTAYLNYHASPGSVFNDLHYILLIMTLPALLIIAHDTVVRLRPIGELLTFVIPFGLAFSVPTVFLFPVWLASAIIVACTIEWMNRGISSVAVVAGSRIKMVAEARAIMLYLTSLAIFAVDFPAIFPRSFCKTELYGFSLMDVGVGLVVFFAAANTKRYIQPKPRNSRTTVLETMWRTAPAFILGISKFIFTKESDYYVSSSEYGVHWNFFFTVFVLAILGSFMPQNASPAFELAVACASVAVSTSVSLYPDLEWQFFFSERLTSFFAANREGIMSCFGYFALHLCGSAFGSSLVSGGYRSLLIWFVCSYTACGASISIGWLPCRRVANFPFVMCSCTVSLFILLTASLVDMVKFQRSELTAFSSGILKGPLVFFLIANALTGLANFTLNPLEMSFPESVACILVYITLLWLVSMALYTRK